MKSKIFPYSINCFILSITILLAHHTGYAQQTPPFNTVISASFGGSGHEEFFGAESTSDGGYILCGLTNSYDGDINQATVYDTANVFVVRCDANGNKVWAYAYGGNDYDKARFAFEDDAGNIVVIGTTFSTDGDITFNHGNSELFVLKLDPAGNIIWLKNFGGTGNESGRYAAQLSDGNYLIGGYTTSSNFDVPVNRGAHDGWLLKIDTAGTVIWSNTYGGSQAERLRYFTEAPDGSIYFAGASQSSDFQCAGNHGDYDFWAGKTDTNGNLIWNYQYGGSLGDAGYQIAAISGNRYLITGNTESSDGDITGYKGGSTDGWIVMIDSSGNMIGQSCLGGTRGDRLYNTIEIQPNEFYSAGFTSSNDVDLTGTNAGPSNEYWLVHLDASLQHDWSFVTGGSGRDLGTEMVYHPADSSFAIMGDSESQDGSVIGNHGEDDFWLVKLVNSTGLLSPPNPLLELHFDSFTNALQIVSAGADEATVSVYDLKGSLLHQSEKQMLHPGSNRLPLTVFANQPAGTYLITLENNRYQIPLKVLIPSSVKR